MFQWNALYLQTRLGKLTQFTLSIEDFNYPENDFNSLPCTENRAILSSFYGFFVFFSVIAFILSVILIRRKSQLRRSLANLVTVVSVFILSLYRYIATGKENVIGED